MSIIGVFGICSQSNYNELTDLIKAENLPKRKN